MPWLPLPVIEMIAVDDSDTIAQRLASWVTGLRFEDLPAVVIERSKQCIIDQMGVQLRGALLPQVQPIRELVAAMGG